MEHSDGIVAAIEETNRNISLNLSYITWEVPRGEPSQIMSPTAYGAQLLGRKYSDSLKWNEYFGDKCYLGNHICHDFIV